MTTMGVAPSSADLTQYTLLEDSFGRKMLNVGALGTGAVVLGVGGIFAVLLLTKKRNRSGI